MEERILKSFENRIKNEQNQEVSQDNSDVFLEGEKLRNRLQFFKRNLEDVGLNTILEQGGRDFENLSSDLKRQLAVRNQSEEIVQGLEAELMNAVDEEERNEIIGDIDFFAREQFLFERIGEWLDQEIARIDDLAGKINQDANTSGGALPYSETDQEILGGEVFKAGIETNIQRLAVGATREEMNVSVEEFDVLQRLYVFETALTQAGYDRPSDLISLYQNLEARDESGKTNNQKIEEFKQQLLAVAGTLWGEDTAKINEFVQGIDLHYKEKARDLNQLEQQKNDITVTREIHQQGAETFTQYIQVVQSGDEEQFAEFLKNNKAVEEILNRHEIKDAELSRRINVLQEKVEGGSISQSIEDIIEKKGFNEEEQMALLNFMEEDPESTKKFIEMMENNPDSGRELISIMQGLEPEQDMKIERTNDGYSIFVTDGDSQIELKLFDKDSGKKGMEGIKLDAFGTALFPFAVTPENFQEIFQIYRAYSQLKEVIPHALPEIINFKEGLEIIDDASLEALRNIIRSSGDQSEGAVKVTDEFNGKVNSMRIKIDARKTAEALSAAEVLQLEKDMFNENFSWSI